MDLEKDLFSRMINLRTNPGRFKFFEEGLVNQFGTGSGDIFGVHVHYHIVDKDPEGGVLGRTRSHKAFFEYAVKKKCKRLLACLKMNKHFTRKMVEDCMEKIKFWDVIRFHKTGNCELHGVVDDEFYHLAGLCGRAYMISFECRAYVCTFDSKDVSPYTWSIAKSTEWHLTCHPSTITEGSFGIDNSVGFGADSSLDPIQKSLNYTIFVEQAIAKDFPLGDALQSKCRPAVKGDKAEHCEYRKLQRADQLKAGVSRILRSPYVFALIACFLACVYRQ